MTACCILHTVRYLSYKRADSRLAANSSFLPSHIVSHGCFVRYAYSLNVSLDFQYFNLPARLPIVLLTCRTPFGWTLHASLPRAYLPHTNAGVNNGMLYLPTGGYGVIAAAACLSPPIMAPSPSIITRLEHSGRGNALFSLSLCAPVKRVRRVHAGGAQHHRCGDILGM